MKEKEKDESRLIDKKTTKQVRIDAGWHHELKILAAKQTKTIRELVEACLAEALADFNEENA